MTGLHEGSRAAATTRGPRRDTDAVLHVPRLYPGLASFRDTPEDRALFFGRETERAELRNLVLSESLVVLFGRSGLGKSSLLNVHLTEDLRSERFFPIPVRLKAEQGITPTEAILQGVRAAALVTRSRDSADQAGHDAQAVAIEGDKNGSDLWQFFHEVRFRSGGHAVRPVLIIDQFEELFTAFSATDPGRTRFMQGLADLARRRVPDRVRTEAARELDALREKGNKTPDGEQKASDDERRAALLRLVYEDAVPDVKIVIAIREDYLPELHSLRKLIPSILRYSLRLEPLTREQAQLAIEGPAKLKVQASRRVTFATGVVGSMLDELSATKRRQRGGEVARVEPARVELARIEPAQLQVLCRFVEDRVGPSGEVTAEHLKRWGGLERAFERYYDAVLNKIPPVRLGPNEARWRPSFENLWILNRPRAATRWLCERGLVDSTGYRSTLNAPVVRRRFGIPDRDVKVLLAERLLNEQPRPDTKAYELAHDSLVRPLMSMRRGRILRQVASVLAVTFVGLGAWQSWRYYRLQQAVNLARQNVDVQRRLAENRNASPEERRVALINIYNAGRNGLLGRRFGTLVLPGIDGSDVHLHGAILDSARLDSAVLNRTILDSASLVAVRLGGASLRLASLEEANLTRASLDGVVADSASFARATLVGASLRGASLVGAKFTNADLSNARFTDADLRFADVRWGVKIDGIDLTGTAWWHARGWSDAQVESLRGRFAPAAFTSSSQYRRFRASLNDGVDSAIALRRNTRSALNASPGEQAVLVDTVAAVLMSAYHRRARFEALFGTHFDSAYSDVEKVLVQPEYARDPNLLDTRAYILLRWSWDDARPNPRRGDARRDLLRALRQDVSAIRPEMGERFYHLGLVYEALKDSVPARVAFQNAATAGYDPTYERALTPSRWAASAYGQRWPYDR